MCHQDASHPGASPSSAGVLVPPKVASITSELLAHAKVQLPLNMWVLLKVLSPHPPATQALFSPEVGPFVQLLQQSSDIHTWFVNLPPGCTVWKIPLLCLCNHIQSSAGHEGNQGQRGKTQSHSFPSVMWCYYRAAQLQLLIGWQQTIIFIIR